MRPIGLVVLAILVGIGAGVGIEAAVTPRAGVPPPALRAAIERTLEVASIEVTSTGVGAGRVIYDAPDRASETTTGGALCGVVIGSEDYVGLQVQSHSRTRTAFVQAPLGESATEEAFQPLLWAQGALISGSGPAFTIDPGPLNGPGAVYVQILGGDIEVRHGYVSKITFELSVASRIVLSTSSVFSDINSAPPITAPNTKDLISRDEGAVGRPVCAVNVISLGRG